ncbi:hypothetical protein XELAEV_18017817mg [Xenopus laevis]|uniref:Uncharacterized protein n=1 Tax=Xenopus laevis TaxID=8355 RepID=A0A974DD35_XENLA|nr:hypothetical protein XELAEV_18017817mg [Xenopus laevis]
MVRDPWYRQSSCNEGKHLHNYIGSNRERQTSGLASSVVSIKISSPWLLLYLKCSCESSRWEACGLELICSVTYQEHTSPPVTGQGSPGGSINKNVTIIRQGFSKLATLGVTWEFRTAIRGHRGSE